MKRFRIKHHLSQRQLAQMIGISRGTYSCWELGLRKPNLKNRCKIILFYIKYYTGLFHVKHFC